MSLPFKIGDRVRVTDSNDHKTDDGTIVKVYPQYMHPEEPDCYTIKLDEPWHGNKSIEVREIGRSSKTLKLLKTKKTL